MQPIVQAFTVNYGEFFVYLCIHILYISCILVYIFSLCEISMHFIMDGKNDQQIVEPSVILLLLLICVQA